MERKGSLLSVASSMAILPGAMWIRLLPRGGWPDGFCILLPRSGYRFGRIDAPIGEAAHGLSGHSTGLLWQQVKRWTDVLPVP